MNFPTFASWKTPSPEDALGRIDRALNDRNHRLCVGLHVSRQFDFVRGVLIVSQGNGKYVRIRHMVESSAPIPQSIRDGCLEFAIGQSDERRCLSQSLTDLAEIQALVFEQLKCQAGRYVDRVLAISVCDPGYWETDFDGRSSYTSMCDATRLAELSGVTVIDAFPARDLVAGGNGERLDALPIWIIFADRNVRVAKQNRAMVNVNDRSVGYFLPASDGLDSEVPKIRTFETTGIQFLTQLIRKYLPLNSQFSKIESDFDQGELIPELRNQFEKSKNERDISGQLFAQSASYLDSNSNALADVLKTGTDFIGSQIHSQVVNKFGQTVDQILVSCLPQFDSRIVRGVETAIGDQAMTTASGRRLGVSNEELGPAVAAILGLFHIDQMPANVPWLTGANGQRILGRLTPGRPANWRQLVRVMADFHPAPMKLKDAV